LEGELVAGGTDAGSEETQLELQLGNLERVIAVVPRKPRSPALDRRHVVVPYAECCVWSEEKPWIEERDSEFG